MKNKVLHSPWRLKYILSKKGKDCIFCINSSTKNDQKHLIIHRSKHSYVIMNMYPYNNGHIMAIPYRHVNSLTKLNKEEIDDLFETVQKCEKALRNIYEPGGINIGLNLGKAAGAGIDEHLHVHIVPRWEGDVNFMNVIGGIRVVPESFESVYIKLKEQFDNDKSKK
ncbi:MAG: HIT domain-containing protein [Candidatus Cloacimonadota bacterium]|nr:HIT domain-containing protein [Candidatus Cloacimonadota bacterium]